MRESIGAVSLINFVIFFILLVFAFLMGTFSYYKAYRVNNAMVSAIEKYEGFNKLSYEEMEQKLSNFGYNKVNFKCPKTRKTTEEGYTGQLLSIDDDGKVSLYDDGDKGYNGYCIYVYNNDTPDKKLSDIYDSYEVTTVITFQFPILQNILKMKVSSKTSNIYNFEASQKCINNMEHNAECDAEYYKN
jgi:hypothetical protein